jgi:hypothetical protein
VKPVFQRVQHGAGLTGDCLRACVASLFEVEYERVPAFETLGDEWTSPFLNFVERELGFDFYGHAAAGTVGPEYAIGGALLGSGVSPRDPSVNHAVLVDLSGRIVHDPHPSGTGVSGEISLFLFRPADLLK